MIIYSAMPLELIFQNEDSHSYDCQEVQINGLTMVVQPVGINEAKIVRLISPNPQDYLNPTYAPGQKIYFRPKLDGGY
ncbi:YlzJ-like family protein [Aneurinibacillus sp. Ricciae_BoGa-3]|uniref:YlzJ-like family protein n=1 Tax=Aneurinibacillus sp. Ricciae_BoGa-3 TaxID=3022697 RepID=UPI002340B1EF|nr:YlzJ-like family protein [Aneurinibacillus sp. Ricciae_BoGa-3]WCK52803.1 YlzJ-like family protein [Aneurinibacillus sp. Ricciae_BoGa-3]